MFNRKRLDNIFYPAIAVIAALGLFLVGFQASGEMTMDKVEAERVAAQERAAERRAAEQEANETDANTEATDDGDW
ncbi:MAG TPA: hypothetical protein VK107_00130 [Alloiococcus sp.]|nr:hypothetical protein [Alloiococcus sp.]